MTGRELKKLCDDNRVTVNDLADILGLSDSYWSGFLLRNNNLSYETELNIKMAITIKKLRLKVKLYEAQFHYINMTKVKANLSELAEAVIIKNVTDRLRPLG